MIGPTIAAVLAITFMLILLLVFFIGYEAGKEAEAKRRKETSYR